MNYRLYHSTRKSNDVRHELNEDRYMFSEYSFMNDKKLRLLVVTDGMGGLSDGEKAAENALQGFLDCFYKKIMALYLKTDVDGYSAAYDMGSLRATMSAAVMAANDTVCKNAELTEPTGSTLSAVCIVDNLAVGVNIGDSPVYFYRRGNREFKLVSQIQTLAEQDVINGLYERYSDEYFEKSYLVTNSLGQYIDLNSNSVFSFAVGQLESGDAFLIGTDGAFGTMTEEDIFRLIDNRTIKEERLIIGKLFEIASRNSFDDQTAMLYIID